MTLRSWAAVDGEQLYAGLGGRRLQQSWFGLVEANGPWKLFVTPTVPLDMSLDRGHRYYLKWSGERR